MPVAEAQIQYEIQDHNIAAGYVTYIVDLWQGDARDPAVGIERYIGVWHEHQLENEEIGAFDPDFASAVKRGYTREPKPNPLVWQRVEVVKEEDPAARMAARHDESMMEPVDDKQYSYNPKSNTVKKLYQAFMAAIDTLAHDDTNEEAWAAIDAWRNHNAMAHEK